jgi:hypothetical protein
MLRIPARRISSPVITETGAADSESFSDLRELIVTGISISSAKLSRVSSVKFGSKELVDTSWAQDSEAQKQTVQVIFFLMAQLLH